MSSRLEEVRRQFWAVHLTLVSIVVALALENLIQHVRDLGSDTLLGPQASLVWLQAGLMALVPLTYWVLNTQLVLALRWDMGVFDAASNVFFLIVMNVLISFVGFEPRSRFFWAFGIGNSLGAVALVHFLVRAKNAPENRGILENFRHWPALWLGIGTVLVALPTAVLLQTAMIGVLGASVATGAILLLTVALVTSFSRAWWQALRSAESEAGAQDIPPADGGVESPREGTDSRPEGDS